MAKDASNSSGPARRPIPARSSAWAGWLAGRIAATAVTPNQISLLSLAFSVAGGILIAWGAGWVCWVGAAIIAQLRLLCNLLDGMVAMEGGKASRLGSLYNDLPDRLSDAALLIPLGYAAGSPWLGGPQRSLQLSRPCACLRWIAGQPQDFSGIMAKQHRMNVLCPRSNCSVVESSSGRAAIASFAGLILPAAPSPADAPFHRPRLEADDGAAQALLGPVPACGAQARCVAGRIAARHLLANHSSYLDTLASSPPPSALRGRPIPWPRSTIGG